MTLCNIYWGSHGCDLERGHVGLHVCRGCCDQFEDRGEERTLSPDSASENRRAHYRGHLTARDDYGFDGCSGNWPYYGSKCMHGVGAGVSMPFFRWDSTIRNYAELPDEWARMRDIAADLRWDLEFLEGED